jgi:hypothetical protein
MYIERVFIYKTISKILTSIISCLFYKRMGPFRKQVKGEEGHGEYQFTVHSKSINRRKDYLPRCWFCPTFLECFRCLFVVWHTQVLVDERNNLNITRVFTIKIGSHKFMLLTCISLLQNGTCFDVYLPLVFILSVSSSG